MGRKESNQTKQLYSYKMGLLPENLISLHMNNKGADQTVHLHLYCSLFGKYELHVNNTEADQPVHLHLCWSFFGKYDS